MSDEVLAAVETPGAVEAVTQVTETVNEPTETQQEAPKGDPKIDDPWPKSARNALSRRDKQIGSLRAREAELSRRLEALETAQKPKNEEPNEDSFDNYGDYLKAVARYKPQDNQQVDSKEIQTQALQQAKEQVYYEQRMDVADKQIQKAQQEIPDFVHLEAEYEDVMDALPMPIIRAFLEADNAPMAFYALAKEGALESLAHMTPTKAAYVIAQAQIRGEQMARASKVSKAPAPIQGATGVSQSGKPLADQSWNELKKNLNLR